MHSHRRVLVKPRGSQVSKVQESDLELIEKLEWSSPEVFA
jgi:hypothetical protein